MHLEIEEYIMGYRQTQTPNMGNSTPHLYSQALQLKLYQAFIFSIPILFSIILFLLFYLFYLKRRSYSTSTSPPPILQRTSNQARSSLPGQLSEMGLKENLVDKLLVILFDEELSTKDSQCCVCLGEFEIKEELHQIPSCKHVFHADCIRHWLNSNCTCPLCRCSVVTIGSTVIKYGQPSPPVGADPVIIQGVSLELQEESVGADPNFGICSVDHNLFEGSSSTSTSVCMDNNKMPHSNEESHFLSIQIHDTTF